MQAGMSLRANLDGGARGASVGAQAVRRLPGPLMRQIILDLGWLSSGNVFALGLAFATTAILARRLGRAGFGDFSYAQAVAGYAALVVDLGLNSFGCRAVAREPQKAGRFFRKIVGTQLVAAALVVLAVAIASEAFNLWPRGVLRLLVMGSVLWTIPYALNVEWLHLGLQRMGVVGAARLIQQATTLAATALFVTWPGRIVLAPLARVGGGLVSAGFLLTALPRRLFSSVKSSPPEALISARAARHFWLSGLLVQVFNGADILIMQWKRNPTDVGLYGAAFRLLSVFIALIAVLNLAMFPALAGEHGKGIRGNFRPLAAAYLRAACLGASLCAVGGFLLAGPIVNLAYGHSYLGSVPSLRVLAVGAAFLAINGAIAQPILAAGGERLVLGQIGITAALNIAVNLMMIPGMGPIGAASAYTLSVGVGTALLVPTYRKCVTFTASAKR